MNNTTKDSIALELVILATVIISAIILHYLLRMTTGIFLPFSPLIVGLYFIRWVGWAIQHCRSRAHLHHAFAKALLPIVFMFGLGGAMLLVTGIRYSYFLAAIISLVVLVGTVFLDRWRRKTLAKGKISAEEVHGMAH